MGCRKAGKERKESRKGAGKGVGKNVKEMNTRGGGGSRKGRKDGWEKGQEGKGGRRSKDLAETESFSIDVDSAVVAVCNASFTLSDSPERKKTNEGGEEGGRDEQTGQL